MSRAHNHRKKKRKPQITYQPQRPPGSVSSRCEHPGCTATAVIHPAHSDIQLCGVTVTGLDMTSEALKQYDFRCLFHYGEVYEP